MSKLLIYPTPLNASCVLRHDSGFIISALPDTDVNGRPGQSFLIPDTTPDGWGCKLTIQAKDKVDLVFRAILTKSIVDWYLFADDFILQDVPPPVIITPPTPNPIPPNPSPDITPIGVIKSVYDTGNFNLLTKESCGKFTEECVKQLHLKCSQWFGELRKVPPQNEYNGHAVDAVHLLYEFGTTEAGIYDIIVNSESAQAKPAFNWVDPPVPSKWYYP